MLRVQHKGAMVCGRGFIARSAIANQCAAYVGMQCASPVASQLMTPPASATGVQKRFFARPSPTLGTVESPPHGGFVSSDVKVDLDSMGGAYARGMFARREIGYDREIMYVPAFSYYVSNHPVPLLMGDTGDHTATFFPSIDSSDGNNIGSASGKAGDNERRKKAARRVRTGRLNTGNMFTPNSIFTSAEHKRIKREYHQHVREMVLAITKDIFSKLVLSGNARRRLVKSDAAGAPEISEDQLKKEEETKEYIKHRVLTMMSGGFSYFTSEDEVLDFAAEVRAPGMEGAIVNGRNYLYSGEFSSYDLQKLPLMLEFNRVDVAHNGRLGICLFPEVQYFNHSCVPNVKLTIQYNPDKENFYLSARTVRPILEGEKLFIDYMPGNELPLSRQAMAMKRRWGFECICDRCKSRGVAAVTMLFTVLMVPFGVFTRKYIVNRAKEKQRGL